MVTFTLFIHVDPLNSAQSVHSSSNSWLRQYSQVDLTIDFRTSLGQFLVCHPLSGEWRPQTLTWITL